MALARCPVPTSGSTSHICASFACDVAQRLQDNARELSKLAGIKAFCSGLAAELANIQQYLADPDRTTTEEAQVLKLLSHLEKLCQWPKQVLSSSSRYSTFDRKQYPCLMRLLLDRQPVKQAMRQVASDPCAKKYRETLLKALKRFLKPSKLGSGPGLSELGLGETRLAENDYQAYIRSLYSSLASHCYCLLDGSQKQITANLRLNSCCTPGESDLVKFRLFFLDHPHDPDTGEICHWQDAEISVDRKRRVGIQQNPNKITGVHSGKPIPINTFCQVITNRKRAQLQFAAVENGLILQGPGRLSQDFLLHTSSISLGTLLKAEKLSRKMRLLLSYFLAKAVWQFYGSEWMQTEWTKHSVHFMFERRSDTPRGISINEPFLSARFNGHCPSKDNDDQYRSHLFPKILSLGIMLTEIELGINIEDYRLPEDIEPNGEPSVNADHFAANEIFNKTEIWEKKETFGAFRDVVQACITPDDFSPFTNDVEGLRTALDKHIVSPLQTLYKAAWGQPETSKVRVLEVKSSIQAGSDAIEEPTSPITPLPAPVAEASPLSATYQVPYHLLSSQFGALGFAPSPVHHFHLVPSRSITPLPDSTMASTSSITSDHWFQQLDKLNAILRPKRGETDSDYHAAKIAILDTGIHDDCAEYIKDYKDFVTRNDYEYQDATNHGTTAVRLVQKVYRMADIFVARVFDTAEATPQTPNLIAQAIRHAKDIWAVDVIILASGFESDSQDLEDAIDEARNARILIFAAASNYGNMRDIAFPARLHMDLKLFCMFSTDPSVRALPHFNPSPSPNARHNFAILGDSIVLPGLEQPVSGTSFATMIGGAFAARILDFSRHADTKGRIRRGEKLRSVEGMAAVFRYLATPDLGYDCMAPWSLLSCSEDGEEEPRVRRRNERTHICETLSRCLEGMHRSGRR